MGYVARGAILVLLTVVVLKQSSAVPERITTYELILLYIAFGAAALAAYAWREWDPSWRDGAPSLRERAPTLLKLAGAAVATVGLLWVMGRLNGPGLPETNRGQLFGAIFLLVLAYPALHHHVGRLVRRNWPYLLAFAALWGVYLHHGSTYAVGSAVAAFPIAVGFLLVTNLFVVPRYVSVDDFLWAVARISAVVVGLGALAYVVGEYTAIFVPVRLGDMTFSPRLLPVEIRPLQAIFGNPNTTGILAFAGTLAAFAELHRTYDRRRADARGKGPISPVLVLAFLVPGALLLVNGVGLYLTRSRASMLAASTGGLIYLAYVLSGREGLPRATLAVVGVVAATLVAIATSLVDVNPGGRFVLWSAGVEALLREPTLLGEGIVETGEIIAPYVSDPNHRGSGVHNSFLTTAIKAGLLGGAAHVVLVVGSLAHAAFVDRGVDGAAIAIAFAFAVHQLFESYTIFHHSMGAILASLVVGFVISQVRTDEEGPVDAGSQSISDVFEPDGQ